MDMPQSILDPWKLLPTLSVSGMRSLLQSPTMTHYCFSATNSRASPGSEKMCANQSIENLLRLGYYSGNPILCCSTTLFLRNNSLYSEPCRNQSAPSEVKSNTQRHSKATCSIKHFDSSYLLGMTNTYYGNALANGGCLTKGSLYLLGTRACS